MDDGFWFGFIDERRRRWRSCWLGFWFWQRFGDIEVDDFACGKLHLSFFGDIASNHDKDMRAWSSMQTSWW